MKQHDLNILCLETQVDMGTGEHVDAAVEYVHEELLQLRLPSGKIEAVYPGSERLV